MLRNAETVRTAVLLFDIALPTTEILGKLAHIFKVLAFGFYFFNVLVNLFALILHLE